MKHLDCLLCEVLCSMLARKQTMSWVCRSEEEAQYIFDQATSVFKAILGKYYIENRREI